MKQLRAGWRLLTTRERKRWLMLAAADAHVQVADVCALAALLWLAEHALQPAQNLPLPLPVLLLSGLLLFVAKNVLAVAVTRRLHRLSGSVALRLSDSQLRAAQAQSLSSFVGTDSAGWVRKVSFQPVEFAQYALLGMQQVVAQLVLVVVTVTALYWFDPQLFLLLLVVLIPPAALLFRAVKRGVDRRKTEVRDANERSLQALLEALSGQPEGLLYGRSSFFRNRYLTQRTRFARNYFDMMALQQLPARALEVVAVAGVLLLLWISTQPAAGSAHFVLHGGAFVAAAWKVVPGVTRAINAVTQLRAWSFVPEPGTPDAVPPPAVPIRSVTVAGVGFRYGTQALMQDVSFQLHRGELVVLQGQSGCGKTTLLQIMLGMLPATQGTVLVNDRVLTPGNADRFWPRIAYLRQQSFLLADTIARNITFEEEPSDPKRLRALLDATGLSEMLAGEGETADKKIAEAGRNLSGGQLQRILLARALYRDADLYLLDEPFNELDQDSVLQLRQLLRRETAAGKIILLITHQPDWIAADRIINLQDEVATHHSADHAGLSRVG